MKQLNCLPLAVGALCLTACADDPPLITSASLYNLAESGNLPEPTPADLVSQSRPYVIGPYDRLSINVFGVEGLADREVQVDASGFISFPLAGTVKALGLTPLQLEYRVAEQLRAAYIRDPQVTVNLLELRSQTVTVEGEVAQPGIYPVLGEMTLLKTLATAQGLDEFARDDIVVFRKVDGEKYAAVYSIGGIRAGNYADPQIFGGDVVIIGESAQKRRFDRILTAAPAFLSPLVFLVR